MELSIIIVNWKSKDYLRKCLASILAETRELEFEIIVIDSASFDGAEEMVRQKYPQVRFIQSAENLGFAGANNRAFAVARGRTILFLNPDTELVGPAINQLHAALAELPDAGALGAKLLNSDGSTQTSCVQAFPTILNQLLSAEVLRGLMPRARLWGMRAIFDAGAKPAPVEIISGACLMMRRAVFEQVGQFSTEYFMYAEDVDLCYKAQQAGFTNYYFGAAVVVHHGGGSSQQARSNFSSVMMTESISQFLRKSRGRFYSLGYRWGLGAVALARVGLLVVLAPILLLKCGGGRWRSACSKWLAIFNWGLGLSRWPRHYQRAGGPAR